MRFISLMRSAITGISFFWVNEWYFNRLKRCIHSYPNYDVHDEIPCKFKLVSSYIISKELKVYIVCLPTHPVPNKAIWTWKKQIKCEGCKMQPYTVDKIAPRDIVNS